MTNNNVIKGSIDSIESLGLHDGPGIRIVVFLNGCKLRCKYCHNPEMWNIKKLNYSVEELVSKIKKFKNYIKNGGGVTFSGGEPLLQPDFLIGCTKKLKEEGFHVALDTAGVGIGKYQEILENVDLILFDIKYVEKNGYKDLTGLDISPSEDFLKQAIQMNKTFWLRQVIIPEVNDNIEYLEDLKEYVGQIPNVEKIDFLPFHKMGDEKYKKLGIDNPYKEKVEMNKEICEDLYQKFMQMI